MKDINLKSISQAEEDYPIAEKENEYLDYINTHITDIQKVWKTLQDQLTDEFWMEDYKYHTINYNIQDHDKSKFSEREFGAYRRMFFPSLLEEKNRKQFSYALVHHYHKNDHHWQHWVIPGTNNDVLDMPFFDVIEMLCDWCAMSYRKGGTVSTYYTACGADMLLTRDTRGIISRYLPLFDKCLEEMKNNDTKG